MRQIRDRKFKRPVSCAGLFLVHVYFSYTPVSRTRLISPARLLLVPACSLRLLRLILERSISILLNDPLAVFLALLWEEASLRAQWDLPNGPAIPHRLRNWAPASPASQPPF